MQCAARSHAAPRSLPARREQHQLRADAVGRRREQAPRRRAGRARRRRRTRWRRSTRPPPAAARRPRRQWRARRRRPRTSSPPSVKKVESATIRAPGWTRRPRTLSCLGGALRSDCQPATFVPAEALAVAGSTLREPAWGSSNRSARVCVSRGGSRRCVGSLLFSPSRPRSRRSRPSTPRDTRRPPLTRRCAHVHRRRGDRRTSSASMRGSARAPVAEGLSGYRRSTLDRQRVAATVGVPGTAPRRTSRPLPRPTPYGGTCQTVASAWRHRPTGLGSSAAETATAHDGRRAGSQLSREEFAVQLRPALRAAGEEANERLADLDVAAVAVQVEHAC